MIADNYFDGFSICVGVSHLIFPVIAWNIVARLNQSILNDSTKDGGRVEVNDVRFVRHGNAIAH